MDNTHLGLCYSNWELTGIDPGTHRASNIFIGTRDSISLIRREKPSGVNL